mmetsp:Transcript_34392/g.67995  ORF Transcript_34392/g.67995 Transcript_34392/m.67995 type:complete len:99 (-) Transcript_34392:1392-1688(-)
MNLRGAFYFDAPPERSIDPANGRLAVVLHALVLSAHVPVCPPSVLGVCAPYLQDILPPAPRKVLRTAATVSTRVAGKKLGDGFEGDGDGDAGTGESPC